MNPGPWWLNPEIHLRQHGWRDVPWSYYHQQNIRIGLLNEPVQVRVHQRQPRHGVPVAQQPRLDMLRAQRLARQAIDAQIDLRRGEIVGRPPLRVDLLQTLRRRARYCALLCGASLAAFLSNASVCLPASSARSALTMCRRPPRGPVRRACAARSSALRWSSSPAPSPRCARAK